MPDKQMAKEKLCGLVAAVFTPFKEDRQLNLDVIDQYVDHLHKSQVIDVFINGTAGEGMSMTLEERKLVAEKWITAGKDKLDKIIVHVGASNLADSQQLAEHAQTIGASAIAALPSLFYKPKTVDALIEYCQAIASSAPKLPFYYYHFPHLTGVRVNMHEFFVKAESAIPTLAGTKFQSSHLMEAMMVNCMHKGVFQVMLACDEVYLGAMAMGIDWAIGTTYNFLPNVVHRMIESFNRGDIEGARLEQNRVAQLVGFRNKYEVAETGEDIVPFKEIMNMIGLKVGPPRLPLAPLSQENLAKLKHDLEQSGFFRWSREDLTPPSSPVSHQAKRRLGRRPLERGTSLLTSDEDAGPPKSPLTLKYRESSLSSLSSDHGETSHSTHHRQPLPGTGTPSSHRKKFVKQSSSTSMLTE